MEHIARKRTDGFISGPSQLVSVNFLPRAGTSNPYPDPTVFNSENNSMHSIANATKIIQPKIDVERLTLAYLREAFVLDADDGILFWKARPLHHFATLNAMASWSSCNAGKVAGNIRTDGRRCIRVGGRNCFAYRIIYALHHCLSYSDIPDLIDHRDGDHANDRPDNLRPASPQQNQFNRRAKTTAACGFKGVTQVGEAKWRAAISVGKRYRHLGTFTSEIEAARAYDAAAEQLHGEFMRAQVGI